ncbi:RNA polymerase ECF-type sigma factor, putative [Shewanella piezotolerans WP3]|uniref:RNA polymerase sigma factor SigZ n=1 Tax=Shewanella piezotolerans (strain WP3 / JCM 13877) TaxID=225849 RepID=B8CVN7_SHEPW|nr:RNA polymerase sigma factor SigZ [Shewanella piezotolerans]ACJ31713.1 RNA polymerase ECF-type sigma factor, putative [Shewanella piezotolerans WP3]
MKLEQIWSAYRSKLKAFLHSKVSNPADVEDLLQDILIKTHSSLGSLQKGDSIQSWLFQIANRTTIDFYRKKNRIKELEPEELWYEERKENIKAELAPCIEPFLKALPDDMAQLLRAVDLEGQSQKAYAEELGLSYTTLKSRVQKGRSELRGLFEGCCHYNLDSQGNLLEFEQKSVNCKKC